MKLSCIRTVTVRDVRHLWVGAFFDLEGRIWRISKIERKNPDDWFAEPEWELTLANPNREVHGDRLRISWLEDELFPRMSHA